MAGAGVSASNKHDTVVPFPPLFNTCLILSLAKDIEPAVPTPSNNTTVNAVLATTLRQTNPSSTKIEDGWGGWGDPLDSPLQPKQDVLRPTGSTQRARNDEWGNGWDTDQWDLDPVPRKPRLA